MHCLVSRLGCEKELGVGEGGRGEVDTGHLQVRTRLGCNQDLRDGEGVRGEGDNYK